MRRLDVVSIAVGAGLMLVAGVCWISSGPSAVAAQATGAPQNISTSKISIPSSRPAELPALSPGLNTQAGASVYVTKRGESIPTVARQLLKKTAYLTSAELGEAIRKANGDRQGNLLKAGESIAIPGVLDAPIVEKPIAVARDFEVRAIYLTGVMAASERGLRIIRRWHELGGNAVVFDIKDSDGIVNIGHNSSRVSSEIAPHRSGLAGEWEAGMDRSFAAQSAGLQHCISKEGGGIRRG